MKSISLLTTTLLTALTAVSTSTIMASPITAKDPIQTAIDTCLKYHSATVNWDSLAARASCDFRPDENFIAFYLDKCPGSSNVSLEKMDFAQLCTQGLHGDLGSSTYYPEGRNELLCQIPPNVLLTNNDVNCKL